MRTWRTVVAALLTLTVMPACQTMPMASLPASRDASAAARKVQTPAGRFKLATYNVENLFDAGDANGDPKKPVKSEEGRQALATSIRALNADVLGMVEVASKGTLRRFRDQYLADMGYQHIALSDANDPRGIDVAVLSRFPIESLRSHQNLRFGVPGKGQQGFSRDFLEVRLKAGKGYGFTVFMTHLKAFPGNPDADAKRKAEVQAIRRLLRDYEKEHPNANYAVMGDFNDKPQSETLSILRGMRERDPQLTDILGLLGPQAFTYHPEKYRSRIDYILLSEGLKREYVDGSATIHNTDAARQASDHLPASVVIDGTVDR